MQYDGSIENIRFVLGSDDDFTLDPDIVCLEEIVALLVEV